MSDSIETLIYVLKDPRNDDIKYVGCTTDLKAHMINHLSKYQNIGTEKRKWIDELLELNLKPIVEVIDKTIYNDYLEKEKHYIELYRKQGYILVNTGYDNNHGNSTSFKQGIEVWNKGLTGTKLKPDKNVYQYSGITGSFIKIWDTAKKAGTELNINVEAIGQCARGKSKTAGGYIWSYDKHEFVEVPKYAGKTRKSISNNLK